MAMTMPTLELENGDAMPALGLGTWKAAAGEVGAAVRTAIELGYRHIDCAPIYGNEPEIGEALAHAIATGMVRRDELWITSKLWNNRHLPKDVIPALKATLADLRIDCLDLFLVHWPVAVRPDVHFPEKGADFLAPHEAPIEDTWAAMEDAVDAGLCRHIGVSNFSPARLRRLIATARRTPEANQVECHPLLAQHELLALCRAKRIILTAYSPLGSPDRPARLHRTGDPLLLEDPVVREIGRERGISPAQVLLAWAVNRGTSVIPKSVTPARMAENLAAASMVLEADQMKRLAKLDRHYRFVDGSVWAMDGSPYTTAWLWDE